MQSDILAPLFDNFGEVRDSVLKSVDKVYAKMSALACERLRSGYESQLERSKMAVRHAQEVLSDEDVRVSDLQESIDETLARIEEVGKRVDALR